LDTYPLKTHTIEHVREACTTGNAMLWPTANSVAVVEVVEYPTGLKTLHHWLTGGDLSELQQTEARIEAYAREQGFVAITTCGRRGWKRAVPGYREVATQLLKEL
jgi:hypothetical protein